MVRGGFGAGLKLAARARKPGRGGSTTQRRARVHLVQTVPNLNILLGLLGLLLCSCRMLVTAILLSRLRGTCACVANFSELS